MNPGKYQRAKETGLIVSLIIPQHTLAHLTPAQSDELAVLTTVTGAEVYLAATNLETEEAHHRLPRVLEVGHDQHAIRWAASHANALAPTARWGNGEGGGQFVRVYLDHSLPPIPTAWRPFRPFSKRFVRNGAKPGIHSRREAQQLQNPLLQGTQSRQMAIHAVDPLHHRQRHLLKRFESPLGCPASRFPFALTDRQTG